MEACLQRLFSTFANGWPGVGLLIQRLVTGIALIYQGISLPGGTPTSAHTVPQFLGTLLGVLILGGLWTPVAGALVAAIELWTALTGFGDPWISLVLATLGGTLAMIGPGAWSVDARLFGRKHIVS
jgi:uncharacterized membrane protein YphA (DoxX/SURF4 family)